MILVTGTVRLQDGARDAMVKAAEPMIAASQRESGCHACRYGFDVSDPNVMMFHEEWESEEALGSHFQAPHLAAFIDATGDLVTSGAEMTKWVGAERSPMG